MRRLSKEDGANLNVRQPPGPWGWPLIGNLPQLGRKPHKSLTELRRVYGDVYQIRMGSQPTIVLNGIDTVRRALFKQSEDFAGRPDFYSFKFIANGKSMGFGDYGPRWKMHRKIAQNALAMFVNDRSNPIEEAIIEQAELLVTNLINARQPVDPHTEVYLSVGNIICLICFGKRYQRDDPDFLHLVKTNDEFMAFAGAGNPVDIMPWMRHLTKRSFDRFLGILKRMDEFCNKKSAEHLETYDASNIRDVTDALISAVREIPEKEKESVGLSDEHIMTTVQEMIGAGFDTIATTLMWAILFMAKHTEYQEKCQTEIDEKIGRNRYPTMDDLGTLPFTEACIMETMRHSCIFPFALPHATTRDTTLNGFFIPDKTLVFVNLWSVNHDEEKFPNPSIFDPYRFFNNNDAAKEGVENFFPFGCGRRRCPGEQLGKIEVFLFLTSVLQRCKLSSDEDLRFESKYGLTLKPEDYAVHVKARF